MTSSTPKPRLLVVDDEPLICALITEGLSREGFECRAATSGAEALRMLERECFDALISDVQMPGMTGLELLEAAHGKYPRLSLLVASAEDNVRVGVAAMQKGAADYLPKPFRFDAVAVAVKRALDKKRLEMEVEVYRNQLEKVLELRTRQLQAAVKRIEQIYDDTLQALGAALDLRDTETEGHSRRVRLYALEIAKRLACSADMLLQIARGSYLHDIGKIGIPDAILWKPAPLTSDEVAIMRTHVEIGYDLVCRIPFLAPAAEIVLTHQEAFDGSGYPQGLQGDEIPLGARIFAVADTLDAMTSDRPYRRALPMATAFEEIRRESGRQFEPRVVGAFLAIQEGVWGNIRNEFRRKRATKSALQIKDLANLNIAFNQFALLAPRDHEEAPPMARATTA